MGGEVQVFLAAGTQPHPDQAAHGESHERLHGVVARAQRVLGVEEGRTRASWHGAQDEGDRHRDHRPADREQADQAGARHEEHRQGSHRIDPGRAEVRLECDEEESRRHEQG